MNSDYISIFHIISNALVYYDRVHYYITLLEFVSFYIFKQDIEINNIGSL